MFNIAQRNMPSPQPQMQLQQRPNIQQLPQHIQQQLGQQFQRPQIQQRMQPMQQALQARFGQQPSVMPPMQPQPRPMAPQMPQQGFAQHGFQPPQGQPGQFSIQPVGQPMPVRQQPDFLIQPMPNKQMLPQAPQVWNMRY